MPQTGFDPLPIDDTYYQANALPTKPPYDRAQLGVYYLGSTSKIFRLEVTLTKYRTPGSSVTWMPYISGNLRFNKHWN